MKEAEMEQIAEFIKQVIIDKEDLGKVKQEVEKLAGKFQDVRYCFQQ